MHGKLGQIIYSDDGNKLQCHICGRFFKNLCSSHVIRIHGLTAYEYKLKFDLCNTFGLVGKETSKKYAQKSWLENQWGKYKPKGGCLYSGRQRLQARLNAIGRNTGLNKSHIKRIRRAKRRYQIDKNLLDNGYSYKDLSELRGWKSVNGFRKKFWERKQKYEKATDLNSCSHFEDVQES